MTVHSSSPVATAAYEIKDEKVAPLFTPHKLGEFQLTNRLVYAPLTRMRCTLENVPTPIMAEYYAQRATAGSLFIAEATYINPYAIGYPYAPGIWNEAQVEAWKPITKAVKDKGAVFFNQLWHCGRSAHSALLREGRQPVGPSAIAIGESSQVFLPDFSTAPHEVPQPLDVAGIKATVADYAAAARNALAAGFDGVEIHGAHGYLVDEFTKDSSNKRTDEYGGSVENRARFLLEVVAAVVDAAGASKVGIRLSPFSSFLDAKDSDPYGTFSYVVEKLNEFGLAYVHLVEPRVNGSQEADATGQSLEPFRKIWKGTFISAGGHTAHTGAEAVATGHADLVAYGRWWLANPDLPKRFALGAPLNKYDRSTFYGGSAKGYTDYPLLEEVEAEAAKVAA